MSNKMDTFPFYILYIPIHTLISAMAFMDSINSKTPFDTNVLLKRSECYEFIYAHRPQETILKRQLASGCVWSQSGVCLQCQGELNLR